MAARSSLRRWAVRQHVAAPSSARSFSAQSYPMDEEFPGVPQTTSTNTRPAPEGVQTTTLKNGVRVVSQDSHGLSSSLRLQINVGSRHENEHTGGLSHLLSRMAFQTTGNRSGLRMMRDMEDAGAEVEAEHGREMVAYTANCLRTKIGPVFDGLAENISQPALKPWEVKERAEVVGMVNCEAAADATLLAEDALHAAAYYDSEPLGQPLYSATGSMTADNLREFSNKYCGAENVVVSAVNVNHGELVRLAEENLGRLSSGSSAPQKAEYVGGEARVRTQAGNRVALGLKGAASTSPDAAAAAVFAEVLGAGSRYSTRQIGKSCGSSLLSKLCNNESGLISAKAKSYTYSDSGLISVVAEAAPGAATTAYEQLVTAVKAAGKATAEEVASAKGRVKAALASDADRNASHAASLASSGVSLGELVAAVDKVQPADVARFAADSLKSAPSFASVGDLTAPRYNKLVQLFQ